MYRIERVEQLKNKDCVCHAIMHPALDKSGRPAPPPCTTDSTKSLKPLLKRRGGLTFRDQKNSVKIKFPVKKSGMTEM